MRQDGHRGLPRMMMLVANDLSQHGMQYFSLQSHGDCANTPVPASKQIAQQSGSSSPHASCGVR